MFWLSSNNSSQDIRNEELENDKELENDEDNEDDENDEDNEDNEDDENDEDNEDDKECLENYFIGNKIEITNGFITEILWTGFTDDNISLLYFNRKINEEHVKAIKKSMVQDFKKNNKFNIYDLVQIGKLDDKYYLVDGQHRFRAYQKLINKNKYRAQKIPCIIRNCETEDDLYELICRINNRLIIKKNDFIKYKTLEIIEGLEKKFENIKIWGTKRPKINKNTFIEKIKNNPSVENMESEDVIKKILKLNEKIRKKDRKDRCEKIISTKIHNYAEENDFYLFYNKELDWINNIK